MPTIAAHIREPSGLPRHRWPITAGVPFAQSDLRDPTQLQLLDADQNSLPCHADVRAVWPDGSIRWLLLDAQVDLEPMQRADFTLVYGDTAQPAVPPSSLNSAVRDDHIDISTGQLTTRLARTGPRLFAGLSRGQREFIPPGEESEFSARDENGKSYPSQVETAEIEESNPLRLVVKAIGGFTSPDGNRLLSWIARIYFFADQDFVRIFFTFVHDQPDLFVHLSQLRFSLPVALRGEKRASLGAPASWFGHGFDFQPLTHPVSLVQWNIERCTLLAETRTDHRVNSHGWIHLADAEAGITLKLRRPWQNYPKALGTDGDRLDLDIYPDLRHFAPPDAEPGRKWTEIDQADGVLYDAPLRIPQGMAKTHELFLRCSAPASDARAADLHCLAFEQPLLLTLPSTYYAATGALGPFQPFRDEYWPLELKLRQFCRPPNGLGMVNYGDKVITECVDGRTRTLTTENLAYELPRSILRQHLRSGDQALFWEGEAAVMHQLDVDTVHFSSEHPEWIGGPYFEWSQNHHYATTDEDQLSGPQTSHTWLGGLLDYYFLTGYHRAFEVAEACADFCRRAAPYHWKQELTAAVRDRALQVDQEWNFSTRVAGWPLTAMGTFHDIFPHDRFLRAMEALIDIFEVWQDAEGRWREQIGSFNRGAIPFMDASVLQGLQLYHQATGDERTRKLLLRGVRFLVHQGRTRDGIFYYKESPISDNPHSSTAMLLGPFAFAFEETRDPQILEAGYRLFRWIVDGGQVATYMLKDLFTFMPLLERLDLLAAYRGPDIPAALQRLDKADGATGGDTLCG
jgi:hypothetical protein